MTPWSPGTSRTIQGTWRFRNSRVCEAPLATCTRSEAKAQRWIWSASKLTKAQAGSSPSAVVKAAGSGSPRTTARAASAAGSGPIRSPAVARKAVARWLASSSRWSDSPAGGIVVVSPRSAAGRRTRRLSSPTRGGGGLLDGLRPSGLDGRPSAAEAPSFWSGAPYFCRRSPVLLVCSSLLLARSSLLLPPISLFLACSSLPLRSICLLLLCSSLFLERSSPLSGTLGPAPHPRPLSRPALPHHRERGESQDTTVRGSARREGFLRGGAGCWRHVSGRHAAGYGVPPPATTLPNLGTHGRRG